MANKKQIRYAGKNIVVINREHGARKGTKRARAMEMLFKAGNTDAAIPKLHKMGADNTFIRYAVENKLIRLGAKKPSGSVPATPITRKAA